MYGQSLQESGMGAHRECTCDFRARSGVLMETCDTWKTREETELEEAANDNLGKQKVSKNKAYEERVKSQQRS